MNIAPLKPLFAESSHNASALGYQNRSANDESIIESFDTQSGAKDLVCTPGEWLESKIMQQIKRGNIGKAIDLLEKNTNQDNRAELVEKILDKVSDIDPKHPALSIIEYNFDADLSAPQYETPKSYNLNSLQPAA